MTTDEAIEEIKNILEQHCPGTYTNGLKMVEFLQRKAEEENDSVQDAMSARDE